MTSSKVDAMGGRRKSDPYEEIAVEVWWKSENGHRKKLPDAVMRSEI